MIAYVGRTGHVIGGPHLHFSITRLPEDDDNFKAGVAINPYLLFLAVSNVAFTRSGFALPRSRSRVVNLLPPFGRETIRAASS